MSSVQRGAGYGYPILPLVHQLAEAAGEAGRYVHWGATTPDIMDTANLLQIRAALDIVANYLRELREILADVARKHRDTPMARIRFPATRS